jgi:hypothetical protein
MKYDTQKIAEAIRKAVAKAQEFKTMQDGGTCNFDSAYLIVPGMRDNQGKEIETLAGVVLDLGTYPCHGRILRIIGGKSGQGDRHTKMAEVMGESLKADGFNVGMWYQMD